MSEVTDAVTGNSTHNVDGNAVYNAITGRKSGIIENGILKSAITGVNVAFVNSSGGGVEYYVCVSSNDTAKTWSGRKLKLNDDGFYEVTGSIENNIPYYGFVPVAGSYYDKNTLMKIEKFYSPSSYLEGIVFAANMQTNEAYYNGNTITLNGANLVAAPGYTDGTKALNSSIEFPFDGANNFADGNFTIAFSAYLSQSGETSQYFVSGKASDGTGYIYAYQYGSWDGMRSKINWLAGSGFNGMDHDIGFGWHHIVIQSQGNKFGKIFVDGVVIHTDSDTNGYENSSSLKQIVKFTTSLSGGSCMKDLQIYNRVLEAAEVEDLYEAAKLPA